MLAMVVLLFSPLLWESTDAGCYSGWIQFGSSCYGFGDEFVSWAGASSLCRIFDGTLAEVESKEENDFLKQHAQRKGHKALWLGGTDIFTEGFWLWSGSKETVGSPFNDWAPGEPNHQGGTSYEDCLQLFRPLGYKWNDAPCHLAYPFVCEVKLEGGEEIGR